MMAISGTDSHQNLNLCHYLYYEMYYYKLTLYI